MISPTSTRLRRNAEKPKIRLEKKSKTALLADEHSALPGNVLHDTEALPERRI
jgi:hypothetical protein